MADGPLGVRIGKMTAFPSGLSLAATFHPELAEEVAAAMAEETRFLGRNMLLGPCVNISRQPFGGRNFESFGEDPFLTSSLTAPYIRGVQNQNVLASVKHFAVNDQEVERSTINTLVDLRTLFEIHLPAFKTAVDAGVWSVMDAYNKINGQWASENDYLNNTVLKRMWKFKGFVLSDWESLHSTLDAAYNGLDLEMPFPDFFGPKLLAAVQTGEVPEAVVDDKVRRLLRAMFGVGLMGPTRPPLPAPLGPESAEHQNLARKLAQESLVLLKNDKSVLPLRAPKTLAVIGPNAATARTGGGGSSHVDPPYSIAPLQGLRERLGPSTKIRFAKGALLPGDLDPIPASQLKPESQSRENGLKAEFFNNLTLTGDPVFTLLDSDVHLDSNVGLDPRLGVEFSARWTGLVQAPVTGRYSLATVSDDGVRLYFDGRLAIDNWNPHGKEHNTTEVDLVGGQWYPIKIEYYNSGMGAYFGLGLLSPYQNKIAEAVKAARGADAALLFVGISEMLEGEGYDRTTLELPADQKELILEVSRANPNTVVVLTGGGPFLMGDWLGSVRAVIHSWYAGQEGGRAIADVLTGHVNPSGKLPITLLKRWEDSSAFGHYPGSRGSVRYNEGIFVGYRHFDKNSITPEYPFGHGLSYTQFDYSNLSLVVANEHVDSADVVVTFDVTNRGAVEGVEVAQLYVSEVAPTLPRPPLELKGFSRVTLAPGETKKVEIKLGTSSFAYFDVSTMQWKANPGEFKIRVGASSRDLRLSQSIQLGQTVPEELKK